MINRIKLILYSIMVIGGFIGLSSDNTNVKVVVIILDIISLCGVIYLGSDKE